MDLTEFYWFDTKMFGNCIFDYVQKIETSIFAACPDSSLCFQTNKTNNNNKENNNNNPFLDSFLQHFITPKRMTKCSKTINPIKKVLILKGQDDKRQNY